MKRLAIFASGSGSNARKIVEYFKDHPQVEVALIVSNKKTAPVLEMAAEHDIPTFLLDRTSFYESDAILKKLTAHAIDFIALAGFLWLIPKYLIDAFPQRIVNIHPALLPKYGGKGMYGMHVHRAVHAAKETESGLTIHFVNAQYDEGGHIFKAKCALSLTDTPEMIQQKVLKMEHKYFPMVIEKVLRNN